jgi:hypothetical protein
MTRWIVMVCAMVAIGFGLMMQLPVAIVGGSACALVGLAPWSHDLRHGSGQTVRHGERKT